MLFVKTPVLIMKLFPELIWHFSRRENPQENQIFLTFDDGPTPEVTPWVLDNLREYKLIVHCGGCMLTRKTMQMRIKQARIANVPIVNYGVLISFMHGAVPRTLEPFSEAKEEWDKIHKSIVIK